MKKRKIRLSAILLFLVMIILIPTTLSIYRETKTKTLGINLTHPNYNLTLDADGGTIPTTSGYTNSQDNKTATKVVTYGHEYGTLPTPVKEGYRFDGWNGKNLANVTDISNINIQTNLDVIKIAAGTYTYSAVLTNNNELITALRIIDSNKNIISSSNYVLGNDTGIAQGNFTLDENKTIIIGVVGKESGYSVDVSNVQLEEGTIATTYEPYYVSSSTNVTQAKNHALTAKYTPNTYSVVFDKNDTNATGTMNNQTFTYDTAQTLTPNAYTKTEYTFTGWNTRADGQGTAYLDGVSVNNLTTTNNGTVTLYAQWIANTYTVTLDANGGTIPTTSGWTNAQDNETSTKTLAYDSPYGTLPTPVKEGYRFDGWNGKNLANVDDKNSITSQTTLKTITLNEGTYTASAILKNNSNIDAYIVIIPLNTSNSINNETGLAQVTFTINESKTISYAIAGATLGYNVDVSNIQLEEGSTATTYEPYYVTSSTNVTQAKNHTLTAIWQKKEATFDTGKNFNEKIKRLSGDESPTFGTANTTITSIQRANAIPQSWIGQNDTITPPSADNVASTNDSSYPIYVWYDNGTIYYYTESLNPYMNTDAQSMFRGLNTCTSIDVSSMDTSKTQKMLDMFYGDYVLTSLDLSNFNTSNVDDMYAMFFNCRLLKTVNLSSFDTSKVTRMGYMFSGTIIENLDISSFDMTLVTNINNMLSGTRHLNQLKTPNTYPSDTSVTIDLPTTLYDASGNSYSTLTSTSPTSTWLKLEYQPYSITYDLDGGSLSNTNPSTYNIDSSSITLNNPTKTNYIFKGWSVGKNLFNKNVASSNKAIVWENGKLNNEEGSVVSDFIKVTNGMSYISKYRMQVILYDENKTYIGKYNNINSHVSSFTITGNNQAAYVRISFRSSGNNLDMTTVDDLQLEEGNVATPYEPYISEQTTVTIPSGSSGNRTYKAIWEPNYYTITFDSNGGTGTMNDQIVGVGATATLNANTFTKTGKKFVGWNTRADGQGTAYLDQDSISSLGSATDTITLYAQWVQLMAEDIGYDGNAVNCNNVQCMIDELYNMLN